MTIRVVRWFQPVFALAATLAAARDAGAVQSLIGQTEAPTALSLSATPPSNTKVALIEPPPPAPPSRLSAPEQMTEQLGGSDSVYGRPGAMELGGFMNFTGASGLTSIQVSPTVGYFLFDDFEISAILGFNYVHQTLQNEAGEKSDHKFILRLLAEPSYHMPFGNSVWGFLGVGLGVAGVPRSSDGSAIGFDIAPRVGANFLVGKSGIFTPAFVMDYATAEAVQTNGNSVLGFNATWGLEAGYTVTW